MRRRGRLLVLPLVLLAAACAVSKGPAPTPLRGRDLPLVRVDGAKVRGVLTPPVPPGSRASKNDCREKVAEGTLHINDDGRVFTYRSTMRTCAGTLLVTETNEGHVERRDSTLTFVVDSPTGPLSFRGRWSDSTVIIYDWGGLLEFARPRLTQ